ncbi:lymphocyte antigen 6E-like [Alligator mississippiensis]|uniref:lymphocyte antigen 6E-like n=1 Tax=Alligator mississippiensis TaxID=8496 RepID=UPI0003D0CDA4|nr:lymphocyte antigen 6E-like [Alligator mississippiensis]
MKFLLVALVAAALWAKPADSLTCYVCDKEKSNWSCLKSQTCDKEDKYCVTTHSTVGLGKDKEPRISKYCSPLCPETNLNIGIASFSASCCESFLCNLSGASSVKTSYTVMAAGILASLLYVLRAGL